MVRKFGDKQMCEIDGARNRKVLVSYSTPVVVKDGHHFFVTTEYFSRTTSKHINLYLREESRGQQSVHRVDQETIKKLVSGDI